MKKALLLFLVAACVSNLSMAQVCMRDSNLLKTGGLLSPAAWSPDSPFYNLKLACIEEPYNQSVTINVPATFTFQGIMLPITSVSIPTTGGIKNYPTGMVYTCDPPNCVFNALTLGCIRLHGTPSPVNMAPDTLDLALTVTVLTAFGPVTVDFPGTAAPDNHYYLILNPKGQCVSASTDPGSPFSDVRALPNPFSQQTLIEVQSTQTGDFRFEVFDLLGNRLHTQAIQLFEGSNQFTYDASTLPDGAYIYTVGNASGKSVRRMIKM